MSMQGLDWGLKFNQYVDELRGEDGKKFIQDPAGAGDMLGLEEAVGACVDGRGDVIVRKAGGEKVTATIVLDKKAISIVAEGYGAAPFATGEMFATYADAAFTDGPVVQIKERCFLEGLGFASEDTGTMYYSGAALLIGGEAGVFPFGAHLLHCRFPKWGLGNRIGLAIEGSTDVRIEACGFEGVGGDFESGIYIQGAAANIDIIRNIFRDCTQGIQFGTFSGGGPDCLIQGNIAVHGSLLAVPNAAVGVVIDNYIPTKDVAAAYGGDNLATLEGYGLWFSNNHYSETP